MKLSSLKSINKEAFTVKSPNASLISQTHSHMLLTLLVFFLGV